MKLTSNRPRNLPIDIWMCWPGRVFDDSVKDYFPSEEDTEIEVPASQIVPAKVNFSFFPADVLRRRLNRLRYARRMRLASERRERERKKRDKLNRKTNRKERGAFVDRLYVLPEDRTPVIEGREAIPVGKEFYLVVNGAKYVRASAFKHNQIVFALHKKGFVKVGPSNWVKIEGRTERTVRLHKCLWNMEKIWIISTFRT